MDYFAPVTNILVDRNNIQEWDAFFMEQVKIEGNLWGYDIETSNREAHDGIKKLMKIDDEGFSHGKNYYLILKEARSPVPLSTLVKHIRTKLSM